MSDQKANPTFVMPEIEFPDPMNIRLAAIYMDISEMRIRTLLREGRVKAEKVEGRWLISKAAMDEYNKTKGARTGGGQRGEGKAWIIRVKYADAEKVKAALAPFGITLEPRYNYEKQAEYRKKRAAKKAAEKAAAAKAPAKSK